ncbi:MAG: DUF2306 domain-containing protein [Saccharospirillaceae bacterium]|nr:DUF2306 domain-containing protein [Pseudomonadales bacterium]NRB79096.1 DUF2306 domain-containing protein [Saccharospirillaceae bacterium]
MSYSLLTYLHLSTILPAFILGTYLLFSRKGSPIHKLLGKIYMLLMLSTALITLFMSAQLGPALFNHFGYIHLFSFAVLYTVPNAYIAVKNGNIKKHKLSMIGLYVGGLLIAGSFTLGPGRLLNDWLF